MKFYFILFYFIFCPFAGAISHINNYFSYFGLQVQDEIKSKAGIFNMESTIKKHMIYRKQKKSAFSNQISVIHIMPVEKLSSASCPVIHQKYHHFFNEWQTEYQKDMSNNQDIFCLHRPVSGKGSPPERCWDILNQHGASEQWVQNVIYGFGKESRELYKKCPDDCSFYTTIVRYYKGDCEKEVSELIVYCGPLKKDSQWNVHSYIINNMKKHFSISSFIEGVVNNIFIY